MKAKKEYLALAAVIAALVVYLVVHRTDQTHYELPDIAKLTGTKITRIQIEKPEAGIELKYEDGNWRITPEGYLADQNSVDPMVDTIQELEVTALVSGGDNYPLYELDPENRIRVSAWSDDAQVRDFMVGKTAPSYRHTFIKLPDDPRVFHARDNFRSQFDKTVDQLRDKTVLAFEKSDINRIHIQKGDMERNLGLEQPRVDVNVSETGSADETAAGDTPAEPVWKDAQGETLEKSEVEKLLSQVANLDCDSFIKDKTKADFTDPIYTLTAAGASEHTLNIYAKTDADADDYPATSSHTEYPFTLASYKAGRIMKMLLPETEADSE